MPPLSWIRPQMIFSVVDLPEPFSPITYKTMEEVNRDADASREMQDVKEVATV